MKTVRCAIYTRKSSDEGLEQDFNSLDAQREACSAYVLSQASEGWKLVPELYDDGGLSGGTLERPALQRLLADVKQGRIDIIVVYKVDRLTRSLLDFSRLVETFDEAKVSFVSVTQSFNTTTSMGRLTLNMLLSFAQFEREVTAERIRDKIAASKARGMWMGGIPPLGYKPDGRSLAIVGEHAAIIRDIFRRYREVGNVRLLAEALEREGIRTPIRQTGTGKNFGGCSFTRGQLYAILKNPVYAGRIPHKDILHDGNHDAIITEEEWQQVQQQLADNTQGTRTARQANRSLLAGLLVDGHGNALQAVHSTKGTRRYRYYVRQDETGGRDHPSLRLPALEIEQLVRNELRKLLADPLSLAARTGMTVNSVQLASLEARGEELSATLLRGGADILRHLLTAVTVHPDRVVLSLSHGGMAQLLGLEAGSHPSGTVDHAIAASLKRSGMAVRLVHDNGARAGSREPDPALLRLVLQARQWWAELATGETDIAGLARQEGVTPSWMTRVVRLAFLAPKVVDAMLAGQLRSSVDAKSILSSDAIAASWQEQETRLLPVSPLA